MVAITLGKLKKDDAIERVLDGLTDGLGLVEICQSSDMPNRRTVVRWMQDSPHFASQCALARQNGAEVHALRLKSITDKVETGELTPEQARVMSSNLIWFASKLNPGYWGDKIQTENKTSITVQVEYGSAPSLPEPAIDAEYSESE